MYENKATFGGGIYAGIDTSTTSTTKVYISYSNIWNNVATQGGGVHVSGVYLFVQYSFMVKNNAV